MNKPPRMAARLIPPEGISRLMNYEADIEAFFAQLQCVEGKVKTFLSHNMERTQGCFAKTFATSFSGGVSVATVGTHHQLRQHIIMGKQGISYQLGQEFKGEETLEPAIKERLCALYAKFVDGMEASILAPRGHRGGRGA